MDKLSINSSSLLFLVLALLVVVSRADTACPNGQYFDLQGQTCRPCPNFCATCTQPLMYQMICLSCPANSHRNINSN